MIVANMFVDKVGSPGHERSVEARSPGMFVDEHHGCCRRQVHQRQA